MKLLTENLADQLDRIEKKIDLLLEKKKPGRSRGAKKHIYTKEFGSIWADYPVVAGANKAKAFAAYEKRLSETHIPLQLAEKIQFSVIEYRKFCEATDRFVMLPATFFGPSKHYNDDWSIPSHKETLPKRDEDLQLWAIAKGYRVAHPGEDFNSYRRYLETKIRGESE